MKGMIANTGTDPEFWIGVQNAKGGRGGRGSGEGNWIIGIIFEQVDIIKLFFFIHDYLLLFFKVATPILVLFARLMHVFLNHIIVMCSLIWKHKKKKKKKTHSV